MSRDDPGDKVYFDLDEDWPTWQQMDRVIQLLEAIVKGLKLEVQSKEEEK